MDTRLRTPLISFCTVQLRTVCTVRSFATLCLSTTYGPGPGKMPGFCGSMVFQHAPISRKGAGSNNNNMLIVRSVLIWKFMTRIDINHQISQTYLKN